MSSAACVWGTSIEFRSSSLLYDQPGKGEHVNLEEDHKPVEGGQGEAEKEHVALKAPSQDHR